MNVFKKHHSADAVAICMLLHQYAVPANTLCVEGSNPSSRHGRDIAQLEEQQLQESAGSTPAPVNTRIAQAVRALH